VGNNKVFSDTIQNFTANPHRRVELVCQLAHGVDVHDALRRLRERVAKIPNVPATPAPEVDLLTFTLAGPVLSVRPYTHNDHYWQVYFDTNLAIVEVGGQAGSPVPQQHYHITNVKP
jgi:small conductance mechanosensitive channel